MDEVESGRSVLVWRIWRSLVYWLVGSGGVERRERRGMEGGQVAWRRERGQDDDGDEEWVGQSGVVGESIIGLYYSFIAFCGVGRGYTCPAASFQYVHAVPFLFHDTFNAAMVMKEEQGPFPAPF